MAELRRFSIMGIRFIRRPVAEIPPEGTIGAVDNGDAFGWSNRAAAKFQGGEWTDARGKPLRFIPSFWIVLDEGARRDR